MTDASNPIEAVRARLDGGRKWVKRTFGDFHGTEGAVCLRGACMSLGVLGPTLLIADAIAEQYPERLSSGYPSFPKFNDHPLTTWADISLVLDKASIAWDEQVR